MNAYCAAATLQAALKDGVLARAGGLGPGLRAVVLTGSVARGEYTSNRSDADLFAIFSAGSSQPGTAQMESFEAGLQTDLAAVGIVIHIGCAAMTDRALLDLPRHIEIFELRECGVVLWGDPDILELVPRFGPEEISREDAWRLLCNRILECLEALADAGGDVENAEVGYRLLKLHLDMATSYLVFAGEFAAGYTERARIFARIATQDFKSVPCLPAFTLQLEQCTSYKTKSDIADLPILDWRETVGHAHRLWRWELQTLTASPASLGDEQLIRRWMQRQSVMTKLNGWLSVLRRCRFVEIVFAVPRWLRFAWMASPRFCIYSAGCSLFFGGATERTIALLPLSTRDKNPLTIMRLVAFNYRKFLTTTTA